MNKRSRCPQAGVPDERVLRQERGESVSLRGRGKESWADAPKPHHRAHGDQALHSETVIGTPRGTSSGHRSDSTLDIHRQMRSSHRRYCTPAEDASRVLGVVVNESSEREFRDAEGKGRRAERDTDGVEAGPLRDERVGLGGRGDCERDRGQLSVSRVEAPGRGADRWPPSPSSACAC